MRRELGTFCLLVVLCVIVAILNPRFLAVANLQNMARLIGAYGVFSIGLGIVIITGGIDLSVGSVFALLGVLLSIMLTEWGWASPLAVCAVIAIGMSLGLAARPADHATPFAAVHRDTVWLAACTEAWRDLLRTTKPKVSETPPGSKDSAIWRRAACWESPCLLFCCWSLAA